jgi:hypothetical protein
VEEHGIQEKRNTGEKGFGREKERERERREKGLSLSHTHKGLEDKSTRKVSERANERRRALRGPTEQTLVPSKPSFLRSLHPHPFLKSLGCC